MQYRAVSFEAALIVSMDTLMLFDSHLKLSVIIKAGSEPRAVGNMQRSEYLSAKLIIRKQGFGYVRE